MRLTTRTNLAARVLMFCAVNPGRMVRAADIAQACNASGNHLAQVIHRLQTTGFVATQRGRTGGLHLARPPEDISIGQLFRTFESGVPFAECFDPVSNTCPLATDCRLHSHIARAVESFYGALDSITLRDLVQDNCGLATLLTLHPAAQMRPCAQIPA
jgi:Rrf2 family nitric oxide-sensitive transcriptional repressor